MKNKKPEDVNKNNSTESTVKKLKKTIEKLKTEKNESMQGWQRERADFANYKKEIQKYIDESRQEARKDVIIQFLQVVDNLDLMMKHVPKTVEGTEWYKGVEQAYKQALKTLEELGVTEIEAKGAQLNPSEHEAIEHIEAKEESGTVVEVIQRGYMLNGSVLRPAKVKVAK